MPARCFLAFVVWAGLCQAPSARGLVEEGFRLYERRNLEAARQRFERALPLARGENNAQTEATAHLGLGRILDSQAQYAAARGELEQALQLYLRVSDRLGAGRAYSDLGSVAWGLGDLKQSRDLYRKALAEYEAVGAPAERARTLYSLAFLAPPGEEKRKLLQQALERARELGDQRLEGVVLHHWGDRCSQEGDFAGAMEKLEQAASLLEKAGARLDLARVLTSLGRVHRQHGHPERALEFYRRALSIQEELRDRQGVIQSVNALGVAYDAMGRNAEARDHFERALALARKTGSPSLIGFELTNLSGVYLSLKEYGRATAALEEALSLVSQDKDRLYFQLARAYLGQGRYGEAVTASDESVKLAGTSGARELLPQVFSLRASAKRKLGRRAEALSDAREALSALEQIRARLVPTDYMKGGFADQFQSVFGLLIELLHESGQHEQALEAAEQGRARAFLDLLASREQAPPQLVQRGGGAVELKSSASSSPFSVMQMKAAAARLHSTLLAYWVSPEGTFIWVVRPGRVNAVRVNLAAERLRELVREMARAGAGDTALQIRGGDMLVLDDSRKQACRRLYQGLIRPVSQWLPRSPGALLTVIPHGPLFRVSFAALLDEDGRYLVERYALHCAPAGALLEFTARRERLAARRPARYLLVADPTPMPPSSNGKPLPPLPGSRREVKAIASLLPPKAVTLLAGAEAGENAVRRLVGDKTVVHFATHGILRDDNPLDSFLALSQHGRLTAQQIYGLNLQADLVVLSACRTALGKISGDGIVGLTRAFFYAGAPSVMATLWDVADEPTFLLVSDFYRSWQRLHDKSRALRAAQVRLLNALRRGEVKIATPAGTFSLPEDPVFWAGFVLQGEP